MYFEKGAYSTADCTVRASNRTIRPIKIGVFIVAYEHKLVIEGHLYASGPIALSTKMNELQNALSIPNESLGVKYDTTQTSHWLSTSGAIGGVVLDDFAWQDTPLSMATQVKFTASFVATYGNTLDGARQVVSLDENITIIGEGGADTELAPQVGLPSTYQTITDYTDVVVTQSGQIKSKSIPGMPSPIVTTDGARKVKQTRNSLSYQQVGVDILLYIRDYSYTFNLATFPGTLLPAYLT